MLLLSVAKPEEGAHSHSHLVRRVGEAVGARLSRMAAKALSGDIGELRRARALRLEADRSAPMSERLARVNALCKQLSAIKGAAKSR